MSASRGSSGGGGGRESAREAEREDSIHHDADDADDGNDRISFAVHKPSFKSTIGVAYYSTADDSIYAGELASVTQMLELKARVHPELILTSTNVHDTMYQQLARNDLNADEPYRMTTLKSSEFNAELAMQRLRLVHVDELYNARDADLASTSEHMLRLRSILDLTQTVMLAALGALLSHLLRHTIFTRSSTASGGLVRIQRLCAIPSTMLGCDAITVRALVRPRIVRIGIFSDDPHPGLSRRHKEGHSVYGVLNRTRTAAGARRLRSWLMHPTTRLDALHQRHAHIAWFVEPDHRAVHDEARRLLGSIKNAWRLLAKFNSAQAKLDSWIALSQTLQGLLGLHTLLLPCEDVTVFDEMRRMDTSELSALCDAIESVIDFEQSSKAHVVVRAHVDEELDTMKTSYDGIDDVLTELTCEDLERGDVPSEIAEYRLEYDVQFGFLARTRASKDVQPGSNVGDWEFKFASEGDLYFKNNRSRELDETWGDVHCQIQDREAAIIRCLEEQVLSCAPSIRALFDKCTDVDCYIALARAAVELDLCRPTISLAKVLRIRRGRHLLEEGTARQFVPNDTNMSSMSNAGVVHVITGPNASGKSVYLKQVGIIVYLAHCGTFVPAESAEIGWCDAIYTQLISVDSVSANLSSFASDTTQVAYMLRHCTNRSLLLMDEYGRGTMSHDGIALLASIVRHFDRLEEDCPRVLVTTHALELFSKQLVSETARITFKRMAHLETDEWRAFVAGASDRVPELVPLYQIEPGVSADRYAVPCARLAGVPQRILERANQIARAHRQAHQVAAEQDTNATIVEVLEEKGNAEEDGDEQQDDE